MNQPLTLNQMKTTERKISIGNKNVFQSEPFEPSANFFSGFVGRESELRMIIAAWISGDYSLPMSPLPIVPPKPEW
jgi:hypothetical protein